MAAPKDQSLGESWGEGLSPVEQKAAQEVTLAFLMAVKNYGLFPPDHASTINMLNSLSATLGGFAERYGPLRLTIEKSRVRYEDEVIFEEPNPDNNPAFIFFRDGLLWLEFLPGLRPHEVLAFFRIISRFKLTQEEPEGDLVTELWSAELEHINYGASENLWEAEPVLEFSLLNPDAQSVLECGVAASVAGFDLLKSVLGIVGAPGGERDGSGGTVPGGAITGGHHGQDSSAGAGIDLGGPGAGTGQGVEGAQAGGDAPAASASEAGAAGVGVSARSAEQEEVIGTQARTVGATFGPPGYVAGGGSGAPVPEEDPDGLDFWAALRRVSPSAQVVGGARESGQAGASGDGSGPARTENQGAGDNQVVGSAEVQPLIAPGQIPAVGGGRAGAAGKSGRREGAVFLAKPGPIGGTPPEVATRQATALSRPGHGGDWEDGRSDEEQYISVNVASIEPGHSLWNFSTDEQLALKQMVRQNEVGDNSSDIIEILLILLKMEEEPQIVHAILAFLKEEFRITLTTRRFKSGHFLLAKVNELLRELPPDKEWVSPLLGHFFEEVSEPEILDALAPVWRELPSLTPEVLQDFASILRLLPPQAGVSLVPLLPQVELGMGRRILLDLIAAFASRDLAILEKMLNRPEEDLVLRLVNVLRENPDRRQSEQLLVRVLRHPKEKVRQEVCDILVARDTEQYDKVFQLINDPSPAIREAAFAYLGRERNQVVEALFLAHLASDRFLSEEQEHVANCYLTLGLCGSDASLSLLKKVLFGQPWNFMAGTGTKVHRHGAALALARLRTKAGRKLLAEAEFSAIPHIRNAWLKANGS
jgi:hypothetical protein